MRNYVESQSTAQIPPTPANELERVLQLSELDLDYSDLEKSFADLTKLAAKVAGSSISLINLIDTFTQWSVSAYGYEVKQMPREESICQYTILEENSQGLEVKDLSADERFRDGSLLSKFPLLKYYFGIPLKLNEDISLGALCVLDEDYKSLSSEKKEMLEIIAGEVVNRIKIQHAIINLRQKVQESNSIKNRVAHDIRGPIGGIIGLAEIIQTQGNANTMEEVLDFIGLIQRSGKSLLELADEILSSDPETGGIAKNKPKDTEFTLNTLKDRILNMFDPQAISKNVELSVLVRHPNADIPFPRNKILQILGNLISNSIKFTPERGKVEASLDLEIQDQTKLLSLKVKDNGVGISPEKVQEILNGGTSSLSGTSGELGYGFGLSLVHHLVTSLNGTMRLKSELDQGSEFELRIPVI